MSPIFVRPVREQFEHDRLIRFLQTKYKRRAPVVSINVGDEQAAPVKLGSSTFFPDIVLWDGKKLAGLIEVESAESVNNLEAMAQWVHFARARTPFHLYVPVPSFEVARRLCETLGARVTELWTYRPTHDGFDLVRMVHDPTAPGATMPEVMAATESTENGRKRNLARITTSIDTPGGAEVPSRPGAGWNPASASLRLGNASAH